VCWICLVILCEGKRTHRPIFNSVSSSLPNFHTTLTSHPPTHKHTFPLLHTHIYTHIKVQGSRYKGVENVQLLSKRWPFFFSTEKDTHTQHPFPLFLRTSAPTHTDSHTDTHEHTRTRTRKKKMPPIIIIIKHKHTQTQKTTIIQMPAKLKKNKKL
jgi:hypothetical protein